MRSTLFLTGVFQGIQRHGEDNNRPLNNVLPVRVDADIGQAVVDDGEDNHPGHHAEYSPYPAAERYAAHHTGGDGVQFVHKAEVIGRRADTTGFQQAAEGVEHAGEGIDHQQV